MGPVKLTDPMYKYLNVRQARCRGKLQDTACHASANGTHLPAASGQGEGQGEGGSPHLQGCRQPRAREAKRRRGSRGGRAAG